MSAFFIFPPCAGGLASPPGITRSDLVTDCSVPRPPKAIFQCARLQTPLPPLTPAFPGLTTRLIRLSGTPVLDTTSGWFLYSWSEVSVAFAVPAVPGVGGSPGTPAADPGYIPTGVTGTSAIESNNIPTIPAAGLTYTAQQMSNGVVIFQVTSALSGYSGTVLTGGISAAPSSGALGSGNIELFYINSAGARVDGGIVARVYNDQVGAPVSAGSIVQAKIASGKLLLDVAACGS